MLRWFCSWGNWITDGIEKIGEEEGEYGARETFRFEWTF